jgi:hypothetical protein
MRQSRNGRRFLSARGTSTLLNYALLNYALLSAHFGVADYPRTGLVTYNLLPPLKAFRIPDDQHESQTDLTVPIQRAATNRETAQ